MAAFVGKWKFTESENLDALLTVLGVPQELRALAQSVQASQEIVLDGDYVIIKTISDVKSYEIRFKFGEEFEETTLEGSKVTARVVLDNDNKITHVRKSDPELLLTREIVGNELITTLEAAGVKAVQKAQKEE